MNTSETLTGFKFQMLQGFDEYLSNLLNCSLENCDSMINKLWVVALKMNLSLRFNIATCCLWLRLAWPAVQTIDVLSIIPQVRLHAHTKFTKVVEPV